MQIQTQGGVDPDGVNWRLVNRIDRAPAADWPWFSKMDTGPILEKMAMRLFTLAPSDEIIIQKVSFSTFLGFSLSKGSNTNPFI